MHIYEERKHGNSSDTWRKKLCINLFDDSVEDIKFAPSSFSFMFAAATADGKVHVIDLNTRGEFRKTYMFQAVAKGVTCVSWNKCPREPQILAVGCKGSKEAKENLLTLWVNYGNKWTKFHTFTCKEKAPNTIVDVSWALLNGRSYHYLVSCGDNGVHVWKFRLKFEHNDQKQSYLNINNAIIPKSISVHDVECKILPTNCKALRATWNYMATVIAVSCADESVMIFKKAINGDWDLKKQIN